MDIAAQAWAVVQAAALGLAAGLLYDLFRVLRVPGAPPPAGSGAGSAVLAGADRGACSSGPSGPGAARCGCMEGIFLFLGGVIYFRLFSRWMLFWAIVSPI